MGNSGSSTKVVGDNTILNSMIKNRHDIGENMLILNYGSPVAVITNIIDKDEKIIRVHYLNTSETEDVRLFDTKPIFTNQKVKSLTELVSTDKDCKNLIGTYVIVQTNENTLYDDTELYQLILKVKHVKHNKKESKIVYDTIDKTKGTEEKKEQELHIGDNGLILFKGLHFQLNDTFVSTVLENGEMNEITGSDAPVFQD